MRKTSLSASDPVYIFGLDLSQWVKLQEIEIASN